MVVERIKKSSPPPPKMWSVLMAVWVPMFNSSWWLNKAQQHWWLAFLLVNLPHFCQYKDLLCLIRQPIVLCWLGLSDSIQHWGALDHLGAAGRGEEFATVNCCWCQTFLPGWEIALLNSLSCSGKYFSVRGRAANEWNCSGICSSNIFSLVTEEK